MGPWVGTVAAGAYTAGRAVLWRPYGAFAKHDGVARAVSAGCPDHFSIEKGRTSCATESGALLLLPSSSSRDRRMGRLGASGLVGCLTIYLSEAMLQMQQQ